MNARLVRNVLSLAVLSFVLLIGFQTSASEASASSMSCAGPGCQNCCSNDYQDCGDQCLQGLWDCQDEAYAEFETCELCQGSAYRAANPIECEGYSGGENCDLKLTLAIDECHDERGDCDNDCDEDYDECIGSCSL